MSLDLDLDLQIAAEDRDHPTLQQLERWVVAALSGRRNRAALTIRLVEPSESQALNRQYRGSDRPTNVLSFPFELPPGIDPRDPIHGLIGDLVICSALVRQEASAQGKALEAHWAHLVVHGVLHLIGYDHHSPGQAAEMESLETAILAGLGFPPPYEDQEAMEELETRHD
ncbi:rRNA maturation RNase YbeY [Caldichromatium japonicum]|uniref:Endoribonuclease YbeY n=1 Tax=Caldichromatium japonicum TaxID=2699430 RepID=A0A6G7VBU3_9GAMM|nr:rRNA maturation RNase YbeY [Caldichromatium japonicum]QIK37529.1 rRNA maturation RNase YbeY [Caldichromatium japonicum]